MEGAVALVLALLAIPFVLPFISWVSSRNTRRRVDELENRIIEQDDRISRLSNQLALLKEKGVAPQGYISALEAKSACENAGKRLCTPESKSSNRGMSTDS